MSVDANGVQTTEISAFPDQLRAIENDMWTKLDDAVPVETQKEFRSQLNLYTTEGQSDGGGSEGMGAMGMTGAMPGGEMGMSARMMTGPGTGPGLLGWEPRHYPLKINISRSGRWFEWSIESKHHSVTGSKAPTLPNALQRFYREPGPWMAVANARATYAAKDWMKLADYFTAEAVTREGLSLAFLFDAENASFNSFNDDPERVVAEISKIEDLAALSSDDELLRKSAEASLSPIETATQLAELLHATTDDVDSILERAATSVSPEQARKQLAMISIFWNCNSDKFQSELMNGEVSSYAETGDTASATLTIPNKPPVPIRFKRENGQWKIDAIGSNELLLERLKQTKIWKQHSESATTEPSAPSSPPPESLPLPAEEPAPPVEATPVDGATGVP